MKSAVRRSACRRRHGCSKSARLLRTEPGLIIKSWRVVPGKLLASGFQFQFSDMRAALKDLAR